MRTLADSESAARDFVQILRGAYDAARAGLGQTERFFQIGGHAVRLCFANGQGGAHPQDTIFATRMTRAFEHLACAPTKCAELEILLWDDATTQTHLPALPWHLQPLPMQLAAMQALNTTHVYVTFNEFTRILNAFDTETNTGFFWVPDARRIPAYEWSNPLRHILHWYLMRNGAHVIHGGAVGTKNGGVVLAGKGGVGKSTTAVACLNSALCYAADDYCMLGGETQPQAHSLYCSAKLQGENLERVPHVRAQVANRDELETEKAIVLLDTQWRDKLILQFPLRAIFLPRVTGLRDTTLSHASFADCVRALTLSTVSILPRTDADAVQKLNRLLKNVPAYHLELGTEMAQIPQVISEFLR